jgi:hypothetical protein
MSTEGQGTATTTTTPATTTTPEGTVATATAVTPAPATQQTDWTTGLTDELRGYVQTKGFKDPVAVLESYRNFEKLHGVPADRLLKLPENLDTPEGRAVFERLGRPKDAKDYSIPLKDEAGGKELAEWFRSVADKANWTQRQLDSFVSEWNSRSEAHVKSAQELATQEAQVQEQNLKRDWGTAYDRNINVAKAGAGSLGLSPEDIDAIESVKGYEGTMKLLYKLGAATGEAQFVSGKSPGVGLLPADQAKSEIQRLGQDPGFVKRYTQGDAEARRTMDNLHKMAYPQN